MTETQDFWPAGATAVMDVTYTQANAAGGAILCEISPAAGSEFILLSARQVNTGTHSVNMFKETATGGTQMDLALFIAAGASTTGEVSTGFVSTAAATSNISGVGYPYLVSGTQAFIIKSGEAGAQNDTLRAIVTVRVKTSAMPTVIHSNSTNPANVSVTAGAEFFSLV